MQRFLQSVPGAGGKFFNSETESDLSLDTRCVMVLGHSYGMISGTSWAPSYLALEIGLYMILLSIGTLMLQRLLVVEDGTGLLQIQLT